MSQYRDEFREVQRNAYWSLPRVALFTVAGLAASYGIGFLVTGGNLAIYRFWAPRQENAKRMVFENTQGYVQGKQDYLSRLRYTYETAEPGGTEQAALRTLILSEASTVDTTKLSPALQSFLLSLASDRGIGGLR